MLSGYTLFTSVLATHLKNVKKQPSSPDWVAQWVGASFPTSRACRFDFQSVAHTWVAGSVPGRGTYRGQLIDVFLSHTCLSVCLSLSLPSSLSKINKYILW